MKNKENINNYIDPFTRFFNFMQENGYIKVTFPESWNKLSKSKKKSRKFGDEDDEG